MVKVQYMLADTIMILLINPKGEITRYCAILGNPRAGAVATLHKRLTQEPGGTPLSTGPHGPVLSASEPRFPTSHSRPTNGLSQGSRFRFLRVRSDWPNWSQKFMLVH